MKAAMKFGGLILIIFLFYMCQKHHGTGTMTVKMTDQPAEFQKVLVDVQRVEIHYSNESANVAGWKSLATNSGIYDLLELQGGINAVLVEGETIPVGFISQMRLVLGNNNNVILANDTIPLELSSQDQTGLKFNIDSKVNDEDNVEVLFDFDAQQSIVIEGDGSYKLKPVIKVVNIEYN